ncbi:MAG: hypothetical protein J2P15_13795 [Micromonosporaceae bacterium]|nr:hypothetical protein [Micromonosporaceae bacterium]
MRFQHALRGAVLVAMTAGAVGFAGSPALAESPSPWQPFRSAPFTQAAGDVCAFAVHGDIVTDHELVRTLQTYPDGTPREQEFVGPLVIRYTNLSTGASVERNLTGTGWWFFDQDGTTHGNGVGHFGIGIHAGNTNPPPGEYVLTGAFDFVLGADGTRTFSVQGGTVENLCQTLG